MTCPLENELLDALTRGYVGAELEAHAKTCTACTELRAVAGALIDDRIQTAREAPIPSAAAMWYRMQLRRQQEAAAAGRRSLLIGHALTLIVALALVGTFFGKDIIAMVQLSTPVLIAIATCTVVAPVAGWVALRQK